MSPESPETLAASGIPPLNFIYACSICCATFADVYQGHDETVMGLSDGIHPKERLVSKLFLASCCHVFCASHLEGGGPPFHPAGQRPQAPCPVCVKEKSEGELRDLYSLRGLQKDECDPAIPASWFVAPPMRLDGSGKEMEALRFQYVALIRYCQNTYITRKPLQDELDKTQKKLISVQDLASVEHAEVLELRQENERLRISLQQLKDSQGSKEDAKRLHELEQEVEQYRRIEIDLRDFETFKQNKSAIKHYMKLVPMLVDQNEKMKDRLAKLGFAMALEPIPNFPGHIPSENNSNIEEAPDIGSTNSAGKDEAVSPIPSTRRPLKRQRLESPLSGTMHNQMPGSRDAMPPPPKPMSRMRSMRKIFPTLRKKFSHDTSVSVPDNIDGDVRMYDDGHWQKMSTSPPTNDDRPPSRQGPRTDTPFMSGALLPEHSLQITDPRISQRLSTMGSNSSKSRLAYRTSSPIRMNDTSMDKAVQLPTEPSYIHLLDGLSQDNGLELGLKDPRKVALDICQRSRTDEYFIHDYQNQCQSDIDVQKSWGLGHPFLHQSRSGTPSSSRYKNLPQIHQANSRLDRVNHTPLLNRITPTYQRIQQPSHQNKSVVSPFFKNNQQHASTSSKSRIAEPQDSSNHFDACQFPRCQAQREGAKKRGQCSRDRLSFLSSPHKFACRSYREANVQRLAELSPHSPHYQGQNVDSQGFITRPDSEQSLYFGDNAYAHSLSCPQPVRRQQLRSYSINSSLPIDCSSHSRVGRLPSSMPSTMLDRSSIHSLQQWENLQRLGVRSSRKNYRTLARNTFATSSKHLSSSSGRHSVRR